MSFKVFLNEKDKLADKYKSRDSFEFHRGGVLCVQRENGKKMYYAPHHWRYLEADEEHEPRSQV